MTEVRISREHKHRWLPVYEMCVQRSRCKFCKCLIWNAQNIFQIVLNKHGKSIPSHASDVTAFDEMRDGSQAASSCNLEC